MNGLRSRKPSNSKYKVKMARNSLAKRLKPGNRALNQNRKRPSNQSSGRLFSNPKTFALLAMADSASGC